MARGGGGNIPGNGLGQGFTSPSTFTHVPGAYGARTGAVGGAADRRLTVTFGERHVPSSSPFMFPLHCRTPYHPLSVAVKWEHERRRTGYMAFAETVLQALLNLSSRFCPNYSSNEPFAMPMIEQNDQGSS